MLVDVAPIDWFALRFLSASAAAARTPGRHPISASPAKRELHDKNSCMCDDVAAAYEHAVVHTSSASWGKVYKLVCVFLQFHLSAPPPPPPNEIIMEH